MEPSENLSEMEAAEVPEDPSITLAQKISSAMRQTCCVKARAAKEEKLKKRLAPVQTVPWPEHYKPPYYYAAKQLRTPAGKVPYIIDVNAVPLSEYSSSQLVRARMAAGEQMGARTLFATVPRAGETAYYDLDREILNIIHDGGDRGGGGYEDGQVEDSDPTQSGNYQQHSYAQMATQQSYTQTGVDTQQQQHWAAGQHQPDGKEEEEEGEDGEDDDSGDTAGDPKKKGRGESFNMREDELFVRSMVGH